MRLLVPFVFYLIMLPCTALCQEDSLDNKRLASMITLTDVVIGKDFNVARFITLVKNDTTFYKAFKNLRILGFTSLNDIRMNDKRGKQKASLTSRTRQEVANGCRTMVTESETLTGDMKDRRGDFNYYTAELYASLFFTQGQICGENNIVHDSSIDPRGKTGIDKRKEQLKMLFFNPGKRIPGIPFMGGKSNIFDPDIAKYYDMQVDAGTYQGRDCFIFSVKARENLNSNERDKIVYDNMTTWFDAKSLEILARNYDLSYNAGAYKFDVSMEVQLTRFGSLQVPSVLRYKGDWDVIFKKRERGVFTATLFDFRRPW
ncbi:hypothetical protein [Terrimonas ferruginea]|uniref:hypothetical protein n=1 Tax=Terrimonas ferruginea TaxID=249 RepID=UPI000571CC01|nr:hypothetical protein [Terrimonas ferruginea]